MIPWGLFAEVASDHTEALAIVLLGAYIAYEIRLGAMKDVQENQKTLAVGLYRVIKRDETLDEEAFREAFWGGDDEALLFRDLNVNGDSDDHDKRYGD